MRVLETILFEYFLGFILQAFSYCLGIYAFASKKIEMQKYLISSMIFAAVFFVSRLLPISFGIHTILNLICLFFIGIFYLKMPPLATTKALLVITVFLLITEFGDIFIFTYIIGKERFDTLMKDNVYQYALGLPASVVFALMNYISYYLLIIHKEKKSVVHGEAGT